MLQIPVFLCSSDSYCLLALRLLQNFMKTVGTLISYRVWGGGGGVGVQFLGQIHQVHTNSLV